MSALWPFLLVGPALSLSSTGAIQSQLPDRPPQTICQVSGNNLAEVRQSVVSSAGVSFHESIGEYDTCVDVARRRLWTFTKPESRRAQSVICRTIFEQGTGSRVEMEIACFGTTLECNAIRDEWAAFLNQQIGAP